MKAASRETTLVGGAVLALLLIAVAVWNTLFTRPLWLDEVHTLIVASRPSAGLVLSDLSAGVDTAPGLLHLTLWLLGRVFPLGTVMLHVFPFVTVWLGSVFLFAALRRRFDLVPALGGTLAVLTHLLVIQMTYEARFYGPWLALAAGFAWSVGRVPGRGRDALVALFAILICTIHWYGVISLGIMCVAVVVAQRRSWRAGTRTVAPAAAGLVVLALCIPILQSQRAAVTAPTWIPEPNSQQAWEMARTFYVSLVPVFAVLILLAHKLGREPKVESREQLAEAEAENSGPRAESRGPRAAVAALASLALMPFAIAAVSFVLQPTLIDRYATVAALAWGPLVALAIQLLAPRTRVLFCVLLLSLGILNYRRAAGGMASYQRVFDADVRSYTLGVSRTNLPIVFQSRHVQLPVAAVQPPGRDRMVFLALPDSTLDTIFPAGGPLRLMGRFFKFEREAALLHDRVYRFPPVRTQAQVDTISRFLLLASDASLPAGYKSVERFAQAVFPRHSVLRLEANLAMLTRR